MGIAEDKRALRRRILATRNQLPAAEIAARSQRLYENLAGLPAFRDARTVHLFAPFGTEVDTRPILRTLWARGARTVLPRVAPDRQLEHCVVENFAELEAGFRSIPEPIPSCSEWLPEEIDLILVPGVAFDRRGGRLGYGGGYYDRFLSDCPAPRVALVFQMQIVDRVPREAHDRLVHTIVTDEEVIRVDPSESAPTPG